MFTVKFMDVFAKTAERRIDETSPEIRFMQAICSGDAKAEDFFNETAVYGQQVFLDAPNGRFHGVKEIQRFCDTWLSDFKAAEATVYPVVQTVAGGKAVCEMEIWFSLQNGGVQRVPMTVFADLASSTMMEGMRVYFFFKFMEGCPVYRRPIFRPTRNKWADPWLMNGVMRFYYEQLHNFRTEEALENIVDMCSDDITYGGYRPEEEEPLFTGKDAIRKVYSDTLKNCPHNNYVRFETFTDNGLTLAVEWTIVVRQSALKDGFVSFAGCAMYERDDEGKLCSIRINDNAGYDYGMDLNSIPSHDMFID